MRKKTVLEEIISSKEIAFEAVRALEDKKGEDIKIIDISEVSSLADYFILASGSNRNQIQALCDNVEEKLGAMGVPLKQREGYDSGNWILIDYRDVVIHIFDKESRQFYDLERIWRDGKLLDKEQCQ